MSLIQPGPLGTYPCNRKLTRIFVVCFRFSKTYTHIYMFNCVRLNSDWCQLLRHAKLATPKTYTHTSEVVSEFMRPNLHLHFLLCVNLKCEFFRSKGVFLALVRDKYVDPTLKSTF